MSKIAIKVDGLSKRYFIRTAITSESVLVTIETWVRGFIGRRRYDFFRLLGRVKGPRPKPRSKKQEFWALKDLTLEVKKGEVLGILGPNGAGKSTLLKILSQITPPTEGRIELHGQVGSLLEVGTGFNPELSGHENIYLYGAILGMDREMIQERYDEIVEFSEIGKFLHQPIKHYSSGMHAKLGFSVAAHLDCEILMVDEILSVGDASFRRKSYVKMTQLITEGKTVLFVSHNMSAINNLCTRAIVLAEGKVIFDGDTNDAVNHYLQSFGHKTTEIQSNPASFSEDETKDLNILTISVVNSKGENTSQINYSESFSIEMDVLIRKANENYFAAVYIRDINGQIIIFTSDEDLGPAKISTLAPGQYRMRAFFPARFFNPDSYRITCIASKKPTGQVDRKDEAVELNIVDHESWRSQQNLYRKLAAVAPELEWKVDKNKVDTKNLGSKK